MINWLHTNIPSSIAFQIGNWPIHWYGLIMAAAMLAAILVFSYWAKQQALKPDLASDLALWLIGGGLIGARLYYIGLEFNYFIVHPSQIIQVWHGGMAIHGALIGGAVALIIFTRRQYLDTWLIAALLTPALALAQAIGRWGNYFNQELFGRATDLPWGIPININLRPSGWESFTYFQPMFLYESFLNLISFTILTFWLTRLKTTERNQQAPLIALTYLLNYSLIRFITEFWRLDPAPLLFGYRWPQLFSLLLVITCATIILKIKTKLSR